MLCVVRFEQETVYNVTYTPHQALLESVMISSSYTPPTIMATRASPVGTTMRDRARLELDSHWCSSSPSASQNQDSSTISAWLM